ncbi:hypothetical protein [Halobacillus sp. A5]|uniref:hypothetical protein n=1 Tax=Halobacillus sp. A5 TaxID=2880263 RepID=UPI0020A64475|nr:hypothetical protein [Halobacillus sp. A5]MCP3025962.1 hypothetical protein [Halobacillus sp. A5]
MKQANLFDYTGDCTDPLYTEIKKLGNEIASLQVNEYVLSKNNFGLIEITADGIFECAGSDEQCYNYLISHAK